MASARVNQPPDWPALAAAYRQAVDDGQLARFRRRRWEYAADPGGWLAQDQLPDLAQAQADALYRAAGGRQITAFRQNRVEDVRDAMDFLLYDTIKLENRFEECAVTSGGFGLAGAGKEWPAYLLAVRDPGLFAPWNPHTERALRRWGLLPPGFRQGHPGLCYIDLLDLLYGVGTSAGLTDFRSIDEFCYLNGRAQRPAPSNAQERITGGTGNGLAG